MLITNCCVCRLDCLAAPRLQHSMQRWWRAARCAVIFCTHFAANLPYMPLSASITLSFSHGSHDMFHLCLFHQMVRLLAGVSAITFQRKAARLRTAMTPMVPLGSGWKVRTRISRVLGGPSTSTITAAKRLGTRRSGCMLASDTQVTRRSMMVLPVVFRLLRCPPTKCCFICFFLSLVYWKCLCVYHWSNFIDFFFWRTILLIFLENHFYWFFFGEQFLYWLF